jgi:flagellar biosynthetic protein FliP
MKKNLLVLFIFSLFIPGILFAQTGTGGGLNLPGLSVNFGQGVDLVDTLQVLVLFTVLTMAPAIIILCTCFTRVIVVLAFMRQAIGAQNMPPNQLLIGLALFLSIFIMQPTGEVIYNKGIDPYVKKQISTSQALTVIEMSLRAFMQKQVRKSDIGLFYDVTGEKAPETIDNVPIHFLIPSFIISELKTAFQIGFLLYIPFLILDMVVASVLMAMGMMMLPPVIVSMPFKLLLFVLVDGWQLVTGSILKSFN